MRDRAKATLLVKRRKNKKFKKYVPIKGTIRAPEHFILFSAMGYDYAYEIDDYFGFLSKLRSSTENSLCIDMSGVRRMVADACLLFKAELSRLLETRSIRITAIPPVRDRIKQVLKQTGISDLLNLNIECEPNREDVVHWKIAEGAASLVDQTRLESIMDDIERVTGMAAHPVYQGIIESMSNCVEHAYKPHPEIKVDMPVNPGWWVFQQVKNDVLSVVVCDLGIGVRRSLPLTLAGEQGLYKKLMHLCRKAKGLDNRALLAAMEYGRTSTREVQRGKGMRNAHRVVDELGVGNFVAMSNAGAYVYSRKPSHSVGSSKTLRLRHSIQGTILGWQLPLAPASNTEVRHV